MLWTGDTPCDERPRAPSRTRTGKVLADAGGVVALEINYEVRTYSNRRRDERIVLVWNTSGKPADREQTF